jgi:CRP/FNR family transcriptional regulator
MNNYIKYWYLENFNLMHRVGKKNLMQLCDFLVMKHLHKGERLLLSDAEKGIVFFLKKGTVKITEEVEGSEITKSVLKEGSIFGEMPLLGQEDSQEKAHTLEDCVICYIEDWRMKQMIDKYPNLNNSVLKLAGMHIKRLKNRLDKLLYKDSEARISEFVDDYVKEFGKMKNDQWEAKNLLTHKDIADLTNTSRQTVSNFLSKSRKEGKIFYDSQVIRLL